MLKNGKRRIFILPVLYLRSEHTYVSHQNNNKTDFFLKRRLFNYLTPAMEAAIFGDSPEIRSEDSQFFFLELSREISQFKISERPFAEDFAKFAKSGVS